MLLIEREATQKNKESSERKEHLSILHNHSKSKMPFPIIIWDIEVLESKTLMEQKRIK